MIQRTLFVFNANHRDKNMSKLPVCKYIQYMNNTYNIYIYIYIYIYIFPTSDVEDAFNPTYLMGC